MLTSSRCYQKLITCCYRGSVVVLAEVQSDLREYNPSRVPDRKGPQYVYLWLDYDLKFKLPRLRSSILSQFIDSEMEVDATVEPDSEPDDMESYLTSLRRSPQYQIACRERLPKV
jgi:hypothetical protein